MADVSKVKDRLERLQDRLADGGLDAAAFQQQVELLLMGLSPAERAQVLGTPTPSGTPVPGTPWPQPGTLGPRSGRPSPWPQPAGTPGPVLGPSGGAGSGLRTAVPRLAELELGPGTVLLGQWRIVRELGRGGFGAVFEAEELNLGQTQALKVLDPAMVAREELLARFRREVALMRQLVHPRIVRVYDYREDRGEHLALISMEYVAGCAVREVLVTARSRKAPIPVGLALTILSQTLEALAAAHGQGVIHRDVTPGNILLAGGTAEELLAAWGEEPASRRTGEAAGGTGAHAAGGREVLLDPQVKLVDFGIAGLVERTELSQKSRVMGTTGYVAPEALDADAEVTAAADVFGAGAVAYELLCGKVPLSTTFRDIVNFRPKLARWLADVVMGLIAGEPARRPAAGVALSALAHARNAAVGQQKEDEEKRQDEAESQQQESALMVRDAPLILTSDCRIQPAEPGTAPPVLTPTPMIAASRSGLVECPLDGKRNRPEETFRCRGCGQGDLCLTHFDPEERICVECVAQRRMQEEVRSLLMGMEFIQIPSGSFQMGSNNGEKDEMPEHRVTVSRPFYLQATPVTQGQWRARMGDNLSQFKKGDDYPVEQVSWNDAQAFLQKLNAMDPGKNYRLPTEAEWEYACRAGTVGERYGELDAIAWYEGNSGGQTHPAGEKQPNAWGLYDMLGNVWEWCSDWYGENYYASSPATDPRGPMSGRSRVLRGGSWYDIDSGTRGAKRSRDLPDSRDYNLGFRCARD